MTHPDRIENPAKVHELKCWPVPFHAICRGLKKHEIRVNDRDFKVGDILVLKEFRPNHMSTNLGYTGDSLRVKVTYMTEGGQWGLPENLCVMSIAADLKSKSLQG